MTLRILVAVSVALAACRAPDDGPRTERSTGSANAGDSRSGGRAPGTVDELLESRVPRAGAGDSGWRYQQRVSADLDGDGAPETAVLIADVALDAKGQPLWEDGHRWQVYVEEADGDRTHVYGRFLPNGKLSAQLTQAGAGSTPRLLLLEQTPGAVGLFEIAYAGPGRAAITGRLDRALDVGRPFTGSPRP